MRRNDKEIKNKTEIEDIIHNSMMCNLGLVDGDVPYIIPINFGYKDDILYFHSAKKGRKVDIINNNNNACFEMDIEKELVKGPQPCSWSMKYRSVIGFGKVFLIHDSLEKKNALKLIIAHHDPHFQDEISEEKLNSVAVYKILIESYSGKKSGY